MLGGQASCAPSDPSQQWSLVNGMLKNAGTGMCVDAAVASDPAEVAACNRSSSSQQWRLTPEGHIQEEDTAVCLAVYNYIGGNATT